MAANQPGFVLLAQSYLHARTKYSGREMLIGGSVSVSGIIVCEMGFRDCYTHHVVVHYGSRKGRFDKLG